MGNRPPPLNIFILKKLKTYRAHQCTAALPLSACRRRHTGSHCLTRVEVGEEEGECVGEEVGGGAKQLSSSCSDILEFLTE